MEQIVNGALYIVATPIGHLGELSDRAKYILANVDFIAAEDTRVTQKLLGHLGVKKPVVSYYRHNEREKAAPIIERLLAGESCALCSDAGTPAISDPGEALVSAAYDAGVRVVPVAGPSAAIAALASSGLSTGRFCFEGFLAINTRNRREHLAQLKDEPRTMIFYEAPHKLKQTLADLCDCFGAARPITLAREMTKLHEEFLRTTLGEAVVLYGTREPRGEYVLVVAGAPESAAAPEIDETAALKLVDEFVGGGMALAAACKTAAEQTGLRKNELYKLALAQREAP